MERGQEGIIDAVLSVPISPEKISQLPPLVKKSYFRAAEHVQWLIFFLLIGKGLPALSSVNGWLKQDVVVFMFCFFPNTVMISGRIVVL